MKNYPHAITTLRNDAMTVCGDLHEPILNMDSGEEVNPGDYPVTLDVDQARLNFKRLSGDSGRSPRSADKRSPCP